MKQSIIILAAFMAAAFSATAAPATTAGDTIKVLHNATSVTVTETPSGRTHIHVNGTSGDSTYDYDLDTEAMPRSSSEPLIDISLPFTSRNSSEPRHRRHKKCRTIWFHDIYSGALIESHTDVMDGGWEIGANYLIGVDWTPWRNGPHFRTGLGLAYRRMGTRPGYLIEAPDRVLDITAAPEGAVKASGHLRSVNLRVPFSLSQTLGGSFYIEVAAILNFNFNAKASASYRLGDSRHKSSYSGLHQRLLTPECRVSIGFRNAVSVYYSTPFTSMRRGYGPQFRHCAVGAALNF